MTKPPTTNNSTADTVNAVIRGANSAISSIVEALIIADLPWLGYPIIRNIFEYLLGWIFTYASKAEQNGATFAIIDSQVANEDSALTKAYSAIIAAQKSGDPEAIKKAIQDYANAHSALINSDGSSTAS